MIIEDDNRIEISNWISEATMWQTILRDLPTDYDMMEMLSSCCRDIALGPI